LLDKIFYRMKPDPVTPVLRRSAKATFPDAAPSESQVPVIEIPSRIRHLIKITDRLGRVGLKGSARSAKCDTGDAFQFLRVTLVQTFDQLQKTVLPFSDDNIVDFREMG